MPKQRQFLATRPVPVLTAKFAFAPSAISAGRSFRVPGGRIPDASPGSHQRIIYRSGNAAEMGTGQGELGDGKSILGTRREWSFRAACPCLHGPDHGDGGVLCRLPHLFLIFSLLND